MRVGSRQGRVLTKVDCYFVIAIGSRALTWSMPFGEIAVPSGFRSNRLAVQDVVLLTVAMPLVDMFKPHILLTCMQNQSAQDPRQFLICCKLS
jgi:hypothetical protein